MSWDQTRFDRFCAATVQMARGLLPGYGYPHVILPYPPEQEIACIEAMRGFPARLTGEGLSSLLVPLSPHSAQAQARYASRPLADAESYARLETDFSDLREGLAPAIASSIAAELKAQAATPDVVLLARVGCLYPFAHVSTLLDALYREGVQQTLAVAYPGTSEGTRLHFLGRLDSTGGYRGHVVT